MEGREVIFLPIYTSLSPHLSLLLYGKGTGVKAHAQTLTTCWLAASGPQSSSGSKATARVETLTLEKSPVCLLIVTFPIPMHCMEEDNGGD